LAQWRFTQDDGRRSVLVVARDSRKKLEGSVYDYVSQHTSAARAAEVKRLLYVAVTRAKTTLTLTRCNAAKAPATDSFSALLGELADEQFAPPEPVADKRLRMQQSLSRWARAPMLDDHTIGAVAALKSPAYRAAAGDAELSIPQSQLNARAEGVVGHLLFEGLAASFGGFLPNELAVKRALLKEGADEAAAQLMGARLTTWFSSAAERENVKFLFSAAHTDAANELTLVAADQDLLRADRTFVTAQGERWLVDFKFSQPVAEEALADEIRRYESQLKDYAALLKRLDTSQGFMRPIRAALYFPWLDLLHEVTL
jgi:ATP-dependent helicase/nuclease subunit A